MLIINSGSPHPLTPEFFVLVSPATATTYENSNLLGGEMAFDRKYLAHDYHPKTSESGLKPWLC